MNAVQPQISRLGTTLVAVSPQPGTANRELIEKHRLGFEILSDPGNEVAATYGLRWTVPDDLEALYLQFGLDLAVVNGDDSWTLPLPARYIIARDGTVRYARTGPDYTRRPELEETLEALRALVG